jgi:hypothetical protein
MRLKRSSASGLGVDARARLLMRISAQEAEGEGFEPSIRLTTDDGFRALCGFRTDWLVQADAGWWLLRCVPSRIGFRETLRWFGSDLMEARPEYLLEANRNRTIVHHIAEGELFGLMRWIKPVATLLARSERTRTVKSLKRSLESG